jgi:LuxR family transcriptional regulator, maltose regulon positive regulatory protein
MVRIPGRKVAVPELPPWSVPRPRLSGPGEDAPAGTLVAVVAPAGAGKTTLLAQWAHRDPHRRTAWVGLDPDDADPRRLWAAVLAAVVAAGEVPPDGVPARLLARLDTGPGGDGGDLADEILDALDALRPAVRLVLDDVHVLAGSRAGTGVLTRLVRRSPAGVHLVVAARSEPPLGLPRLRLEGRLVELGADRLRFTGEEAAALLDASGVRLAPADLAVLHRRTEGWAAGLRLATLALRDGADPGGVVERFTGDEPSVAAYLGTEVLADLPPATRTLLQEASVCGHLPAPLVAALTGRTDAAHALEELVHAGAMVERVAPAEYRLHGLLRSHLVADLERHRPARYRDLHAAAARWWTARQETAHALRHADRAGDPALSAAILRRAGVPLLLAGDLPLLRHALAVVGPRQREDPCLALTTALADLESGDLAAAATELARAREAWPARPDRSLEALRDGAELLAAGCGATTPAPTGHHAPEPEEPELAALLHAGRAAAALGADADEALEETGQVPTLARQEGLAGLETAALTLRAVALCGDGDLGAVVAVADEARAVAARAGRPRSGWTARAAALAAYADLLRGHAGRARTRCADALAADPPTPETAYALHVVHGTATGDGGGRDARTAGLAEARAARAALGAAPLPGGLAGALAVLEHRAALRLGDDRAAGEVLAWLAGRVGETADVVLMRAWAEVAAGRPAAARALSAPLRAAGSRGYRLVELDLLDAEAALHDGDDVAGRAALTAAVVRARGFDLVRPFGDAGPRSRALLAAPSGTSTPHDERVAAACAAVPTDSPSLSEREMVVLALLPSLLNAPAMADELIVSVNTVKTQIRSIYAKLGVSTRREAVSRAHECGLLV